jgi:uroporphyrinogen-III synthase
MRLLVTRPRDDSEALAAILRARGHTAIVAPVMEVRPLAGPPLPLIGVQGVLATSANGARAIAARTERRDVTLFAVGPQTAEAARKAGFARVVSADGDAAAMVEKVAATADPAAGTLFHAAGAETAGRVQQSLQARGFAVESAVLYEAVPVGSLATEAIEALRGANVDGVLLFSPRSARIFAALVKVAGLEAACAKLDAFCISAATAVALGAFAFARIVVAGEPNQAAMLAILPPPTAAD